jgi:hypothetical protein
MDVVNREIGLNGAPTKAIITLTEAAYRALNVLGIGASSHDVAEYCLTNFGLRIHGSTVSDARKKIQREKANTVAPRFTPLPVLSDMDGLLLVKDCIAKVGGIDRLQSLIACYKSLVS